MKIATIKTPGFLMEANTGTPKYQENGGNMTESGGFHTLTWVGKNRFLDENGHMYEYNKGSGEFELIS